MRRLFLCLLLALPCGALAQNSASALRSLATGDDTKGWEGVGRLNIDKSAFCTGTLIDESTVLTAAHCLFNKDTGARIAPDRIEFLAGWRNGRAEAYRAVTQTAVHPDFLLEGGDIVDRVSRDLALLRLDRPIRTTRIHPFSDVARLRRGDEVGVVSYARDREDAPSLQQVCHVLGREQGAVMLSCTVDFGSSGAPIFVLGPVPRIASVVSSKADVDGKSVALAAEIDKVLPALRRQLDTDQKGAFANRKGLPTSSLSAKFLKP